MTKLVVPIAVIILLVLATISVIASFRPGAPVAVLPPHGISIEEIQQRVDVQSLPVLEIADLY
jgi:hypothetical protein